MTVEEDHAADRTFAVAVVGLMVIEVALAAVADAGVIAIWLWCVLAVMAIFAVAGVAARGQARAGTRTKG